MMKYADIIRKYAALINDNGQKCPFEFKSIRWLTSHEVILRNSKYDIDAVFYADCFEIFLHQYKFMLRVIDGPHGLYCQWYNILSNIKDSKYHEANTQFIRSNEIEEIVDDYFLNILMAPWRKEEESYE